MSEGKPAQMKILVVDDERETTSLLKNYLESGGAYKVLTASSGSEAIDLARSQKPDLIILDIVMPGLNGFDVIERLKQDEGTARIPVILTSISEGPLQEERIELGIVDFLRKPIDLSKLDSLLASLRRSRAGGRRLSILVIDDEESDLALMRTTLEGMGFDVATAQDGETGLRIVRSRPPDLVIVDYFLPIRNGVDVIRELKVGEETAKIPVLLISAYIPENSDGKLFLFLNGKSGPMTAEELCRAIRNICPVN